MILQALKEFYDRKASGQDSNIAPEGFEKKELQFLIVIDEMGEFINIEDTREKVGKKLIAKSFVLPRSKGRSGSKSYATTFLLWDHIGYVLGLPPDDKNSSKQHHTWLQALAQLPEELKRDVAVGAILKFYSGVGVSAAKTAPQIEECLKSTQRNMSFRLVTDSTPVPCRKAVKDFVSNNLDVFAGDEQDAGIGTCLVTGEKGVIVRTHGKTFINKDSNSLISFQKGSGYDSFGKEQGYNAPIIKSTEFAYVTALNSLLKTPNQRMQIGDATTVFWSQKKTSFESDFAMFFSEPPKDDPSQGVETIKKLFYSVRTGSYVEDEGNIPFYVLGLSPNSARIAVRFWHMGTITEFAKRIKEYFEDFALVKPPNEPEHYSIWRILVNIAIQDKSENIPPNIAGSFMRSILDGTPYPSTMFQAAIRRIRSDSKNREKPVRIALIKAYLNRYNRFYPNPKQKEVEFSLDPEQPSIGYQLGRLFAVLEKIQEEANPGINTTIRERYYGAACSTPVTVFTILLRLKNHHLAKLENKGRVVNFERLLGEIMERINDFPAHLSIHDQGRFAIGYYHQRQDFFTPKVTNEKA